MLISRKRYRDAIEYARSDGYLEGVKTGERKRRLEEANDFHHWLRKRFKELDGNSLPISVLLQAIETSPRCRFCGAPRGFPK